MLVNPRLTPGFFDVVDRNFSEMKRISENARKFVPKVDIRESKDAYVLDMELAGYSEDEVEIELNDKVLSVFSKREKNCCSKTENTETEEKILDSEEEKEIYAKPQHSEFRWLVKERGFGLKHFSRSFTLPEDIDGENVNATFKNGLLTITVPKKTETKSRKIAISA